MMFIMLSCVEIFVGSGAVPKPSEPGESSAWQEVTCTIPNTIRNIILFLFSQATYLSLCRVAVRVIYFFTISVINARWFEKKSQELQSKTAEAYNACSLHPKQ